MTPDDGPSPNGDEQPMSPFGDGLLTPVQLADVAIAEWYRRLRKAGMPVLGAAAYIATTAYLFTESPPATEGEAP